jgi:Ni/Co efflux regulator RcnB
MKRLLCAVAAIAMIVPGVAAGQPQGSQQDRSRPDRKPQTKPARPGHNRPQPGRPSIQPVRPPHNGNRPGHRPPITIQPIKPTKPYRPGHRPPTFRPIHRPGFHYPHGYRYRRWHIGLVLPHIFLSHYYYVNDWNLLGLGPPPPGYVWVRYGPDLLLVNRYNGRIADVIYGAFY